MNLRQFFTLLLAASALAAAQPITLWQQAIKRHQLDVLAAELDRVANIDAPDDNGNTALMVAARAGALDLAERLMNAGAAVNAVNHTGGTALMFAAAGGDLATLRWLLAHGAAVNTQSVNGWSALMLAAVKNHLAQVRELCAHGAEVNLPDVYGWTPLMRAVYEGRAEVVEYLLQQATIDLERHNDHGQTALHLAAIQGHAALASLLLAKGARQGADFAGHTPQSIAKTLGNEGLLALLARYPAQH